MKRTTTPWMPATDYGQQLTALSVNLLVTDIQQQLHFAGTVLEAKIVYADEDIAVLRACTGEWMLHTDHTYTDHPMTGIVAGLDARGAGIELRLHGRDPDLAVQAARDGDYTVLAAAMDKPHGLREAYIVGPDGYIWVPNVPLSASEEESQSV